MTAAQSSVGSSARISSRTSGVRSQTGTGAGPGSGVGTVGGGPPPVAGGVVGDSPSPQPGASAAPRASTPARAIRGADPAAKPRRAAMDPGTGRTAFDTRPGW